LTNLMMLLLVNHDAGSVRGALLELLDTSPLILDLRVDHQDVDRLCMRGDPVSHADRASPGPASPMQSSSSTPLGSSPVLDQASLDSASSTTGLSTIAHASPSRCSTRSSA
jgi:hypothetical protein